MALVLPDGYGIATITWTVAGAGSPAQSVIGYDNGANDATTNAERFGTLIQNHLLTFMANPVFLDSIRTVQRDGMAYTVAELQPEGENQGQVMTPSIPSNTSWLIKKVSGVMGRANTGRWYLPGVPEASVDASGGLDPAIRSAFQGAITDGMIIFNAGGPMVLLHRNPLDPDDYSTIPPTDVTNLLLDGTVATQRRRLR